MVYDLGNQSSNQNSGFRRKKGNWIVLIIQQGVEAVLELIFWSYKRFNHSFDGF